MVTRIESSILMPYRIWNGELKCLPDMYCADDKLYVIDSDGGVHHYQYVGSSEFRSQMEALKEACNPKQKMRPIETRKNKPSETGPIKWRRTRKKRFKNGPLIREPKPPKPPKKED